MDLLSSSTSKTMKVSGFTQKWLQNLVLRYYSERGEDCPPRLDPDLFEYLSKGEEFHYVFEGGTWICYDLYEFDSEEPEIVEILRFSDYCL